MASKKLLGGAALAALGFALGGQAFAQETTSAVRGEVTGDGASALADVEVIVTHVPTGSRSVERTGPSGIFDLRGLRVGGPYTVEFQAPDYQGERYENVFLTVGQPYRLDVDLESTAGEIVVIGTMAGVSNATGSNTVLSRDAIDGAVSITRDIRDLARRDPLVSQNSRGDQGISIAGSNPRTNRITIDGVQAQDDFGLNTGGLPTRRGPISLDAVRQFSIEAAPFDVENGDFLGGAVNIVLREGNNDLEGSAFVNYLNEGLLGTIINGQKIDNTITQENWGGTLRGPIIPNRLFFALSYETYESADATSTGPAGQGFANTITGPTGAPMTLTDIAAVTDIFENTYGSDYPFGSMPLTKPITDEKYTARVDWNITDNHLATLTYRHSESGIIQRTNLSSTSAGLDSQWYLTGEDDETLSVQINSDWTSALSTEFRLSKRDYTRLQEPPAGQAFSDIRVCSAATSALDTGSNSFTSCRRDASNSVAVVRFGADQFRHANFLETDNTQAQFSAEYQTGSHLLKAGLQWQETDIFNLFLPNSDGTYYFDSVADFAAGRANELIYRNTLSGDPNDAAAQFAYDVFTAFAQDTWDITENFTLNYGVRYDAYATDDKPALNPNFSDRYSGETNQETYDGRDVIMPRISAIYDFTESLRLSGGIGLFSGGLPDVFLSNVFSNTGILDNTLTFQRTSSGNGYTETSGSVNCVTNLATCQAALDVGVNSSFGTSVPALVQAALGGSTVPAASETNSIASDFEIPAIWKANIALSWDFGKNWAAGFDAVALQDQYGLAFRDIRAQPLIVNGERALTPDGRLRYDALTTVQRNSVAGVQALPSNIPVDSTGRVSSNRDIQAFNPDSTPLSWMVAVSLSKFWENGVDASVSYSYQNLEEYSASARFSSTASSLYSGQYAAYDPNQAEEGRSQEEMENIFKYSLGWRHDFVKELETRFTLFGEWRAGRPLSFTMNGGSGRNTVFGVNRSSQLAYVPDLSDTSPVSCATGAAAAAFTGCIASDPLVSFDNATTINNLTGVVEFFGLEQGRISPRGEADNPDVHRLDLQISQQFPAFFEGHRALLTLDIANVLNLIDDEWGVVHEYGGGNDNVSLYSAACADASGSSTPAAAAVTCERYRISSAANVSTADDLTRNTDLSRWVIQIGLKYEF